ncbi:hypothetical protein PV08_08219 [Exophiala spinifera]|uniref:Uncharacterized protein n=1 Tax=Exophiala spinifera TaxID=91928 RepID=A0A0D1ZJR0_9EURO|nr:uncharacterized protein PV08_08219 [Exophiala spinifera]KIW13032.1 hypothetical protein PV08_08219 [Exophiala spinifera]
MSHKSRWDYRAITMFIPDAAVRVTPKDLHDKTAFIDAARPEGLFLTRNQFRLWSQLRSPNFQSGDRVLVCLQETRSPPPLPSWVSSWQAASSLERILALLRGELANQLRDSGSTYLLCSHQSIETGVRATE